MPHSAATAETKATESEIRQAIAVLRRADRSMVQDLGWDFVRNHYYEPLVDPSFLSPRRHTLLSGNVADVDWNDEHCVRLAGELAEFVGELAGVPQTVSDDRARLEFHWRNPWWQKLDPIVQYTMIRRFRPRRYVEVGCGMSSLMLEKALLANDGSDPSAPGACQVTLVDPSEKPGIWDHLPKSWNLNQAVVQDVPVDFADHLEAGDILFYDGSHCVSTGSDVNWMFFNIFPRLRPGVIVHLHDIFLPFEYPDTWVFDMGKSWNEQYLLLAFLMSNKDWQIDVPVAYLSRRHSEAAKRLANGLQPAHGGSFWMTKLGPESR